ncbi:MAG: peptidoglycan bridge formation glycyltransferase FemA/FemB family protein [Spirochaetaceae bacterium]|nr:MAG: peptidoglycan bridge formation glycyltransferase FemA/FemB family protein [Spirochaetaceae bacterium]
MIATMRVMEVDPRESCSAANLLQSPFWAHFKQRIGHRTLGLRFEDCHAEGTLLAVERAVGSVHEHLYIPHGPEVMLPETEQGPFLLELSDAIAATIDSHPTYLRYDLPWESPFFGEGEQWPGRPEARLQELRMNFGTGRRDLRKAPTDIQPPDTVIVDLQHDDQTLLSRMRPKTRYNIRLAARHGVVTTDEGQDGLPEWHRLYCRTCDHQRIVCEGVDYFRSLFDAASADRAANPRSAPRLHLFAARYDHEMVAGLICAVWKRKAYYLYGASSRVHRNLMATYAVQWHTLLAARTAGCSSYDMFGVPPRDNPAHPMYGLYRFKTGFGGRVHHFRGCWDYPIDAAEYRAHAHAQTCHSAYHRRG